MFVLDLLGREVGGGDGQVGGDDQAPHEDPDVPGQVGGHELALHLAVPGPVFQNILGRKCLEGKNYAPLAIINLLQNSFQKYLLNGLK